MKISRRILIFISIICFSFLARAQFHFGARAGNNLADMAMNDIKNMSGVTKSLNKTFHIGGIVQYDISSLSDIFYLESGLFLSWKGTEIMSRNAYIKSVTITPIFLEVPVNALYNVNFGASDLQFFAGPYLGFGVAGKIKSGLTNNSTNISFGKAGDMKLFDFGLNIGAGIRMDDILVRIQYGYGLTNLDTEDSSNNEIKNRVIGISIGCMFSSK